MDLHDKISALKTAEGRIDKTEMTNSGQVQHTETPSIPPLFGDHKELHDRSKISSVALRQFVEHVNPSNLDFPQYTFPLCLEMNEFFSSFRYQL